MSFDLITMGRVGVDLYPEQIGVALPDVRTFAKSLGGTATNVAVAAARLGADAAVVTKVGDDPFGTYVRRALEGFGVDARYVSTHPTLRTPIVFCEIFPPDEFPLLFYREPKAPDMELTVADLDLDAIRAARIFWVTGTGLSDEPSRSATLAALAARGRSGGLRRRSRWTVLDLDYRPMFWDSREAARRAIQEALPYVTVAVGNQDECETAVGVREPRAAAEALRARGVELAVVKQGPRGVLAVDRDGGLEVPPVPVDVVCGLGAGDAFGGALAHGLLEGWDLERTIRLANAAGSYVAGRLACADAMPRLADLEPLVTSGVRA
jgi:5-dehydro-2-deoxygluconokinase